MPDVQNFRPILHFGAPVPLVVWLFISMDYTNLSQEYDRSSEIKANHRRQEREFAETPEGRARRLEDRASRQLHDEALARYYREHPEMRGRSHGVETSIYRDDIIGKARELARREGG
jgi:hypothetical protein